MADLLLASVVLQRPRHAAAAQLLSFVVGGVVEVDERAPGRWELVPGDASRTSEHEREVLVALFGDEPDVDGSVTLAADAAALGERLRTLLAGAPAQAREAGYVEPGRWGGLTEKGEALRADLVAIEDTVEAQVSEARAHGAGWDAPQASALPWAVLFGHDPGWVRASAGFDVAGFCRVLDALTVPGG